MLRILFILFIFIIDNQFIYASDWKKNTRFQIAFGGEENIFESIDYKISDQYFRGFLTQNWIKATPRAHYKLNLAAWGAAYTTHTKENKYFLKLANKNTVQLTSHINWKMNGQSQIKKFIQLDHGFWQNYFSSGVQFQLSTKTNVHVEGSFENYQFFNNNQFNLCKYSGRLKCVQLLQPNVYLICGLSIGKVTLPNRVLSNESYEYESQNDKFYSLDIGLNYNKNIFFNGFLHFEKQNSNFSGLDYFLVYSNITFAYKLFTRLYVRSNLRFQKKSYRGGFLPDQKISIDPEVGEGSNGNIDFVYLLSHNWSIIFRSKLFKQESVLRNKYYSNQIFEIMLELK